MQKLNITKLNEIKFKIFCPPIQLMNFSPRNQSFYMLLVVFPTISIFLNSMIMYFLIY